MRYVHTLFALSFLVIVSITAQSASAAGFALYEGGASGGALGGTTARADDPSAIYFNPAGITQLEGAHVMGGVMLVAPMVDVRVGTETYSTKRQYWFPPHLYGTLQVNDLVWAGVGIYSRFGLGTKYDETWPGRFNSYNAEIQSLTLNPNMALKLSEKVSIAGGLSAMWFDLTLKRKHPSPDGGELDFGVTGDSVGYGYNVAIRYEPVEKVAIGVSYLSSVKQEVKGDLNVGIYKTGASGELELPDMLFLGVAVRPVEKLSVEVGTMYNGWGKYDELKISVDNPALLGGASELKTEKNWKDVWRYYLGAEYALNNAWSIRTGYIYDPTPVPDETIDYMLPDSDRHIGSVGCGFRMESWRIDLSYSYVLMTSRTVDARPAEGIQDSKVDNGHAHIAGLSLSKNF